MDIIALNKKSIIAVILALALAICLMPQGTNAASGKKGFTKKPSTEATKMIKIAKSKIGKPYVGGAAGPNAFDCSGFVAYVMKKSGVKFTRGTAASYYKAGYNVGRNIKKAQKGDIILYSAGGGICHCAIYVGGGKVIHATCSRGIAVTRYNVTGQSVAAIIRTYTPAGAAKITVSDKSKKVAGTKYKVVSKKTGKAVKTVKTNSKGIVTAKSLKAGTYEIEPMDVDQKYVDDVTKTVKIKNGKTSKVKFVDIFSKIENLKNKAKGNNDAA